MYNKRKNKQDRRKRNHLKLQTRDQKGSQLIPGLNDHPISSLLPFESSENFGTEYNLKVASPLARIRPSVLFFFSP